MYLFRNGSLTTFNNSIPYESSNYTNDGGFTVGTTTLSATVTTAYHSRGIRTSYTVDLTNYNYVSVKLTNNQVYSLALTNKTTKLQYVQLGRYNNGTNQTKFCISTSTSGNYISTGAVNITYPFCDTTLEIKEWWLE